MNSLYSLETYAALKGKSPEQVAQDIIDGNLTVRFDEQGYPGLSTSDDTGSICIPDFNSGGVCG